MAHRLWQGAADRNVPHQPLALAGDLFNPGSKCQLNGRRIHELVRHLIHSGQFDAVVRELTSPAYIAAKFALGEGAQLMREYAEAEVTLKKAEAAEAAAAAADLAKCKATVGRFLKRLEQQPPLFALQMCIQEPDRHPLCVSAKAFLEGEGKNIKDHVVEWTNKCQELDPCQLAIQEHTGAVNAVAYFPGGERIASASSDKTIKICNTTSGEVEMELLGHEKDVRSVAISPDGKRLASGGEDKTVRVWDAATGTCESTLRGEKQINCVAFSPDGSLIAAGDGALYDAGTIRLDAAATGAPFGSPLRGHSAVVRSVCFSSDGKQLTSGSEDKTVRNWDLATRASLS